MLESQTDGAKPWLEDVTDGSAYLENALFTANHPSLELLLYEDAFETVNPLGATGRKHKLVVVHFTLANFRKPIFMFKRRLVFMLPCRLVMDCSFKLKYTYVNFS